MANLTIFQKEDGVVVWVHQDLNQQKIAQNCLDLY